MRSQHVSKAGTQLAVIAGYTTLVICMWAWYGFRSGMGYETAFMVESERLSDWRAYFYGDSLRRFTSLFYHFAYVMGRSLGETGSFIPYQVVYALLWLFRGLLVFQIVCILGEEDGASAFLAGAFTILHAADTSLNWVGQLNQAGFILWMLASFYFLLKAFALENRRGLSIVLAMAATLGAGLSIYSYESPLVLIFGFPILVLILFFGWSWRKLVLLCIYYSVPLVYCLASVRRYVSQSAQGSYQFSVLRKDWNLHTLLTDWGENIFRSVSFWRWPQEPRGNGDPNFYLVAVAFSLAGAITVAGVYLWLRACSRPEDRAAVFRPSLRVLALGFAMVMLSFPVYLLLEGATSNWRTQLLSGPGAGIVLASLVTMAAAVPANHRGGAWIGAMLAAGIAVLGIWAAQGLALMHRSVWEQHRAIVAGVLSAAPRLRDNTIVVLVNHRPTPLIFGHNMWWDLATRLAYPQRMVAGVYFDRPGQIAAGARLSFAGPSVELDSDFPTLVRRTEVRNVVVLDVLPGDFRVADAFPGWLDVAPEYRMTYQPDRLIGTWPPDDRARRRYSPRQKQE